jgi:PPOX class probable F420-dependent enzyme
MLTAAIEWNMIVSSNIVCYEEIRKLVPPAVSLRTGFEKERTTMALPAIPDTHRDLLENNQVAILATVGPDGSPQVTASWFLAEEDGTVKMSLNTTRQKVKNLMRCPESSLFFMDPANPYRTLEIRARAEIEPDADYVFADQVGTKYGGADVRSMDQPGETRVVITFVPIKVNTFG